MSKYIQLLFKALRSLKDKLITPLYNPMAKLILYLNGADFGKNLKVKGAIRVTVTRKGKLQIGESVSLNSGNNYNVIGRQQKNIFWVDGNLSIGNNVGISTSAIICKHQISIGNNVIIGGNTVIYDTDFHNLDPLARTDKRLDKLTAKQKPVIIMDNVFIGAHVSILKGVTIGENSIIGACSVVTKNVPSNEIWAGNPAGFIKKLYE